MRRLLAVGLSGVLAGCGLAVDVKSIAPFTPEPIPSVESTVAEEATQVAAAFLERMANPEVTYRVVGTMAIGQEDANGMPRARVVSRYDVAGDDYAGYVQIRGTALDQTRIGDYHTVVLDGSTHFYGGQALTWISAETPEGARVANPYAEMSDDDLLFIGKTDGDLFEFAVVPWVGGDPIGEWIDVGVLPEGGPAPMTMESHRTRITIDADGIPHRLTSHWTFVAGPDAAPGQGAIFDDYQSMGLYVDIAEPTADGFFYVSSHDLLGGEIGRGDARGPWFEVKPSEPTAELHIAFEAPEEPIMLGIEGAIGFIRSHAPDGDLILDRITSLEADTVEIPAGSQTLVAYYRPCDGNCAVLDGPMDFCSVEAEIEAGVRYELTVQVVTRERADCALMPAG